MYRIVLEYQTGRSIEAVVLRVTDETMRVVPQGARDTTELCRLGAEWVDEAGNPVSLGFLDLVDVNAEAPPLVRRAGG